MIKKFALFLGSLFLVLVIACSGGGTVDPNAIAENSHSSNASSSSVLETENGIGLSSSSLSGIVITDANVQCQNERIMDDTLVVSRGERIPPFTYRYVGTERTTFTIENISLTCDIEIDTLKVQVSGDSVVVKAKYDYTNALRCICKSRIDFAVDNDDAYIHASLLYFDDGNGALSPEIMAIVDAE